MLGARKQQKISSSLLANREVWEARTKGEKLKKPPSSSLTQPRNSSQDHQSLSFIFIFNTKLTSQALKVRKSHLISLEEPAKKAFPLIYSFGHEGHNDDVFMFYGQEPFLRYPMIK